MWKISLFTISVLLFSVSSATWSAELEGLWKEYDDDTGKLSALIRIEKISDGTYSGIIEKVFSDAPNSAELVCSKCSGKLLNHPLIGLPILTGLKRKNSLIFNGGTVLDPDDGKSYNCIIRLSEDGDSLELTGYISVDWIGQSEVWRRENN